MHGKLRRWTHRYFIWATLCGLGIVLFVACATPDTTEATATKPTPSPVKAINSPHPTVVPSPARTKPSTSCNGYKEEDVCIIDPEHILTIQPASPDTITPMIHDMALTVSTGVVTVSQKYGALYLAISDQESTIFTDIDSCKELIFSAFFVTEHDYLFPATNVTCHIGNVVLTASLSKKTAKKIDWETSITAAEESTIAWKQYDTHYETA